MNPKFYGLYRINAMTVFIIGLLITTFYLIAMVLDDIRGRKVITKDRLVGLFFSCICLILGYWWLTLL